MSERNDLVPSPESNGNILAAVQPLAGLILYRNLREFLRVDESELPDKIWTTLDLATPAGKAQWLRAKTRIPMSADDALGSVIRVRDILMWHDDIPNHETGQLARGIRTIIIQPNGVNVGFVSVGVCAAIWEFVRVYGIGPYDPPLDVRIEGFKTRKGRTMLSLTPVIQE